MRSKTIVLNEKQRAYLLDLLLRQLELGEHRERANEALLQVYNAIADRRAKVPVTLKDRVLELFEDRGRLTRGELMDAAIEEDKSPIAYAKAAAELCRLGRLRKIKPGVYGRAR